MRGENIIKKINFFSNHFIMNSHNYEMATPINSLQHSNINNLVKNVENNIETMNVKPIQQNLTYNPNIIPDNNSQYFQQQQQVPLYQPLPVIQQVPQQPRVPVVVDESNDNKEKKSLFKSFIVNSKEYLIIILLFSLLAHKKINKLFYLYVPGLVNFETPIPSLILRGLVFAILLFFIKNFI
jgi:hypothetical protein